VNRNYELGGAGVKFMSLMEWVHTITRAVRIWPTEGCTRSNSPWSWYTYIYNRCALGFRAVNMHY